MLSLQAALSEAEQQFSAKDSDLQSLVRRQALIAAVHNREGRILVGTGRGEQLPTSGEVTLGLPSTDVDTQISTSFGVVELDRTSDDDAGEALIAAADSALYNAKSLDETGCSRSVCPRSTGSVSRA